MKPETKTHTAIIAMVLFAAAAFAQSDLTGATRPKTVVTMAPPPPTRVIPGKPAAVKLNFRVAPGYHINSNQPRSGFLIPTTLKLDAQSGLAVGRIIYPPGQDLTFAFSPNEKLNVYTGDFEVTARVSAVPGTPLGRYRIHGELTSQACDNKACYPPRSVPVAFDVRISRPASSGGRRNPGQSPHIRR